MDNETKLLLKKDPRLLHGDELDEYWKAYWERYNKRFVLLTIFVCVAMIFGVIWAFVAAGRHFNKLNQIVDSQNHPRMNNGHLEIQGQLVGKTKLLKPGVSVLQIKVWYLRETLNGLKPTTTIVRALTSEPESFKFREIVRIQCIQMGEQSCGISGEDEGIEWIAITPLSL